MTNDQFNPERLINRHYLYQCLVNPENKKSKIDFKNVPKKHRKAVNALLYRLNRWITEVSEITE